MSEGITVGKVSTYGNGVEEYMAQIWQMMISARNGTFPLQVSTSGGAGTLSGLEAAAGITPAPDGTYSLPTSITIKSGIITAIS